VEPVPGRASGDPPARILIEHPTPVVDCGRYLPKRTVGETVDVGADIFRDGHEVLRAVVRWKAPGPGKQPWQESPLRHVDAAIKGVRWEGSFPVEVLGRHRWTIEAWVDELASWRDEIRRKADAGQEDLGSELAEGGLLLRAAAKRAKGDDRTAIAAAADVVEDATAATRTRVGAALDPALVARCDAHVPQGGAQEVLLAGDTGRARGERLPAVAAHPAAENGGVDPVAGRDRVLERLQHEGHRALRRHVPVRLLVTEPAAVRG